MQHCNALNAGHETKNSISNTVIVMVSSNERHAIFTRKRETKLARRNQRLSTENLRLFQLPNNAAISTIPLSGFPASGSGVPKEFLLGYRAQTLLLLLLRCGCRASGVEFVLTGIPLLV